MFLQLASEFLDAETKAKMEFLDYWSAIGKKLPGGEVGMKESMSRLNKARVGLKHSGIIPDKSMIEGFRSSVTSFFQESTPRFLKIRNSMTYRWSILSNMNGRDWI